MAGVLPGPEESAQELPVTPAPSVHVPFVQSIDPLPVTDTLSMLESAFAHDTMSVSWTGMYCGPRPLPKSQKSAPVMLEHVDMQPPVHPADAVTWHIKFAWTLQLPLQLALHSPLHIADGPWPLQLTSHWLVQLAMHCPMQVEVLPIELHSPEQFPMQLAEQLPEQLKLGPIAVHWPMQVPVQPPVQVALALAVHPAVTLAVQLIGWQLAVQPPDVSTLHVRLVAPAKSMFPHAAMGAAWALVGQRNKKAAVAAAAIADKELR
jgi:hypothetical protein